MKILDNGIAIVESDTHIGTWIRESGRIDHDLTVQDYIIPMFKPDWWVCDVGADVGSHTVRYAHHAARVFAFEPNREQFACLAYNCRNLPNVTCFPVALSDAPTMTELHRCENAGAGHLSVSPSAYGEVMCLPLDAFYWPRLDFLKIDVEGFEPFVLNGAQEAIARLRPVILIEMNAGALARYAGTYHHIFERLARSGYEWRPFPTACDLMNTPQYDLLATPK